MTKVNDAKGANHDASYSDHLDAVVYKGRRKLAATALRAHQSRDTALHIITKTCSDLGWPTKDLASWYGFSGISFSVITAMCLGNAPKWRVAEEMEK